MSYAPKYWLQFTLVFFGYLIAGRLGQATTNIRSSNLGPVWPAYGVALASILLCGYRIWPAVASAAFVVAFLSPEWYLTALGQAAGSTLAAVTGVFLLRRLAEFDNSISRLRDAVALVLMGGLGSAAVSATFGTLVLHASDVHAYSGLGAAWLIYWLGDITGVLLVTPLILTIPNLFRIRGWARVAELSCLMVMLVGACMVVFDDLPIVPVRMLAFAILPLIIWAAVRFGVGGAALSIFTVASVATVETALGSGSFASSTPFVDGVQLDAFFMVLSLTGLALATLYSERDRAESERAQSLREQVAMEARLQNEERLRNSEERLREYERAVEGVEEMIVVLDREYRYLLANRKFLEMRNMTPEQVVGHLASEVLNEGVFESVVKEKVDQCFGGEVVRYELKYTYPKIGERTILASYFPIEGTKGIDRIACIFQDITDRKMAEASLRESEERFRVVADTAPVMIWMSGVDKQPTYFNQAWLDFTGRALVVEQRSGLAAITHPDDFEQCRRLYIEAFDSRRPFKKECRLRRHDGEYRWVLDSGVPRFLADGSFVGYIGSCIDVTDHKLAEEALSNVNRRLIEAHEQERTRIARELHDDINQRLVLLAVQLEAVKQGFPGSEVQTRDRIREALESVSNLGSDIQTLAHRLHSSKLEYLGLEAASSGLCRELSAQQKIDIDFLSKNIPKNLPMEISLCLFRVLQEALQNATKHSGSRHLQVLLEGKGGSEIDLTVQDSGIGFEPEDAIKGRGLGLSNMRERLRLVDGQLDIDSRHQQGTTIHAHVPLSPR